MATQKSRRSNSTTKISRSRSVGRSERAGKKASKKMKHLAALKSADMTLLIPLAAERELMRAAQEWSYILKNRARWKKSGDLVDDQHQRCRTTLSQLGLKEKDLRQLGNSDVIEVSVPWTGIEEENWAARIMPWEFLLSSIVATPARDSVIIRHLDRMSAPRPTRSSKPSPPIRPEQVAMIVSAPDPICEFYGFSEEAKIPTQKLSQAGNSTAPPLFENLDLATLEAKLKAYSPNPRVWHFSGVDNHQGRELMQKYGSRTAEIDALIPAEDGLVLGDSRLRPRGIAALNLAESLGNLRPELAIFNIYRSAARTGALMVAYGAKAAIGFQDTIKDHVAELFIRHVYEGLNNPGGVHHAFLTALRLVRAAPQSMSGTGIVLWSETPFHPSSSRRSTRSKKRPEVEADSRLRVQEWLHQRNQPLDRTKHPELRPLLAFDILERKRMNYSLLHNGRSPLQRLKIIKSVPGIIGPIRVKVKLDVGVTGSEWVRTFQLTEDAHDLAEDVLMPLTAFGTMLCEDTRSSLTVTVTADSEVLYENSFGVTLAPAHEWEDSDSDRRWLPSFVLPDDPAIEGILGDARRYLAGLREDNYAGFDGYQSFETRKKNFEVIDDQVQSLWHTVQHDRRLQYINPPSGTHSGRQRLRVPKSIVRQGRGTCIDLALLFASCLESVEIYPVLFLLNGHAFAGYWRTERAHEQFVKIANSGQTAAARSDSDGVDSSRWSVAGKDGHREITRLVQRGDLVPLETTGLTFGYGFHEAIREGIRNLRNRDEFHSIIDVALAREESVTPLPTLGDLT